LEEDYVSLYQHGDLVFAKVKGHPFWPARIDCVRLEKCRKKKQKNQPEDQNSYWPIFFYGTHETLWINEADMRPFEANRETLGAACKKPKFKEAMIEAFTNPCILFQFEPSDGENIDKWLNGDEVEETETNWVHMELEEIEKEKAKAEQESKKKKHDKGGEVESEFVDIVSKEFEKALFKVADINIGDSIGGMYDVACYGQVIDKTANGIKVQFYTRKKTTPSDYIIKKKDTDTITTQRQGYIFFHLKQENIEYLKQGRIDIMRFTALFSHDAIDKEWNKWNNHTLRLQGIQVEEEHGAEAEDDTEQDGKRRRRSRRPAAVNQQREDSQANAESAQASPKVKRVKVEEAEQDTAKEEPEHDVVAETHEEDEEEEEMENTDE